MFWGTLVSTIVNLKEGIKIGWRCQGVTVIEPSPGPEPCTDLTRIPLDNCLEL